MQSYKIVQFAVCKSEVGLTEGTRILVINFHS